LSVADEDQVGAHIHDTLLAHGLELVESLDPTLVTELLFVSALDAARLHDGVVVVLAVEASGGIGKAVVVARGRARP
jgi:hypothetical protein